MMAQQPLPQLLHKTRQRQCPILRRARPWRQPCRLLCQRQGHLSALLHLAREQLSVWAPSLALWRVQQVSPAQQAAVRNITTTTDEELTCHRSASHGLFSLLLAVLLLVVAYIVHRRVRHQQRPAASDNDPAASRRGKGSESGECSTSTHPTGR